MKNRIIVILATLALSIPFLISMGILFVWLGGMVFGSSIGADGQEYVKNSGIIMLAAFAVTVIFAVWFYRFFSRYRSQRQHRD